MSYQRRRISPKNRRRIKVAIFRQSRLPVYSFLPKGRVVG